MPIISNDGSLSSTDHACTHESAYYYVAVYSSENRSQINLAVGTALQASQTNSGHLVNSATFRVRRQPCSCHSAGPRLSIPMLLS